MIDLEFKICKYSELNEYVMMFLSRYNRNLAVLSKIGFKTMT